MERKTNKGLIAGGVILCMLGLASEVTVFTAVGEMGVLSYVSALVMSVALIIAIIYIINGYGKKDAKLYKLFLLFFAIATLLDIAINASAGTYTSVFTALNTVFLAVSFGALCTLYFAKDLGEIVSKNLALAPMVINIIILIMAIFAYSGSLLLFSMCLFSVRHIILGAVLYISVKSKYEDKEARGTI